MFAILVPDYSLTQVHAQKSKGLFLGQKRKTIWVLWLQIQNGSIKNFFRKYLYKTWETFVDCMESIGKCQQWLISPRNCFENALYWGPCIFVPRYGQARNTGEGCLALCWGDHNNAKEKVFPMHYHSITHNTTIIWMPKLSLYNAVAWILFSSEYCNCENVICVVI